MGPLEVNDYVIVKLIYNKNTKKEHEKNFVAQIDKVTSENVSLNFLRKKENAAQFYFPHIPDKQAISNKNILKKLTKYHTR